VRPKEGEDEEIGNEESIYPSADYEIPKNLLTRLIKGLKVNKEQDDAFFTRWYQASWTIIKFLWMITNGFANSATMRVATSDCRVIYHMIKCNQELLLTQSDQEVVINVKEEKLESEDKGPKPGEARGTEDIQEFDGGSQNTDVPPGAFAPPAVSGHICNSRIAELTTPKPWKNRMRITVRDLVEAQILISTSPQTCRYGLPRLPRSCWQVLRHPHKPLLMPVSPSMTLQWLTRAGWTRWMKRSRPAPRSGCQAPSSSSSSSAPRMVGTPKVYPKSQSLRKSYLA
jgi:hypothetical protein